MKKPVLLNITKLFFILFTFLTVTITAEGKSLIFFESFDELQSVIDNGGYHGSKGWMKFIPGFRGNAADFTGSKNVCYPMINNLDLSQGTLEFWLKSPNANHLGMFDIGSLGRPNSWGIFKNANHIIMEVKNSSNRYDQAWSPGPISADGDWHLITAVWEVNSPSTYFKICSLLMTKFFKIKSFFKVISKLFSLHNSIQTLVCIFRSSHLGQLLGIGLLLLMYLSGPACRMLSPLLSTN